MKEQVFSVLICAFLLGGCALGGVPTPIDGSSGQVSYILVTPNPEPSRTPFQPSPLALVATNTQPNSTITPAPTKTSVLPATEIILPSPTVVLVELPTDLPAETPTSSVIDPPTAIPTSAPVQVYPQSQLARTQYTISAQMDYSGHSITVSENVNYPNRTSNSLSSIALGVNPNLWSGVFELNSILVNDQNFDNYELGGQWLTINLDPPLQPGGEIKIGIGYRLSLPASSSKFENFGYTSRQTNLIDWYPFVPPYINGQWVLPDPYMYGENLVYDKADFLISLTFTEPDNAPIVAASAAAVLQNNSLVYTLPNARNFTFSASPDFLVSKANANGITIYNYYFPAHAEAAANVLELTRMAVNTYSVEFGPYPHTTLSVCETELNDGLETDGLYFLASNFYASYDGGVKNNLSTIAVHETAHQWWYGAVGNNQAVEPWLDEALSAYSEHVFYEDNYPDNIKWWWNFRVDSHVPSGWVDSKVYDTGSFKAYVNAVYFEGAHFLQDLRDRIGDQVFYEFLRDYYARNNGQIANGDVFFSILSEHTTADISDLLKTYFYYR